MTTKSTEKRRPDHLSADRPRGLFCYGSHPESMRRSFRPDMVALAMSWMAGIPAEDLQYLVGIAVSDRGGLIVHFAKAPKKGGPALRATFRVDQGTSSLENDRMEWIQAARVVPYSTQLLDYAVEVAAEVI